MSGPKQEQEAAVDVPVSIPDGTDVDGAVVELAVQPDGRVAAEVRIPARPKFTPVKLDSGGMSRVHSGPAFAVDPARQDGD